MAKNTSGLPQPGDYILGRGTVYVNPLLNSIPDPAFGWRDLGNSPEFTLSIETEKLEHKSSRAGLQVVDKEVILSQKMSIAFSIDEFNDDNLALWSQGATATHTNVAIAGFSIQTVTTNIIQGNWYDIQAGGSSGERAYDTLATDVTVEDGAMGAAVKDTDYVLDEKMGRIQVIEGSAVLTDAGTMKLTLAAEAGAAVVEEVQGLTGGQVLVAVKFIAENPASSNKQREYQFHSVTLASEGDVALIGDEFATMGFSGAVESNTIADADAPFVRVRDHADS